MSGWPGALCYLPLVAVVPAAPLRLRAESIRPTHLQIGKAVTVAGARFTSFLDGFRCDTEGNVFTVPFSPPVPRAASGAFTGPDTIVRISADGSKTTRFNLSSVPEGGSAEEKGLSLNATVLDGDGGLYALVSGEEGQYILSFDRAGRYKSKVGIDPQEIGVTRFAVFRSGPFLLSGQSPDDDTPRLGIMPAGGGPLRDVVLSRDPALKEELSRASKSKLIDLSHAEPGSSHVYFARPTPKASVLEISPSGEVSRKIALAPPRRGATLSALKVSRHRLAAIYETRSSPDAVRNWISVYDPSSGELSAVYGPVANHVMCFLPVEGGPDRFTLLRIDKTGEMQLVEAWAR